MYTENYEKENTDYSDYDVSYEEDDDSDNSSNGNNKLGLIVKIIIIIICIAILILLIISLKKNSGENNLADSTVHVNNVDKVRLASEDYFFNNANLPKEKEVKKVTLKELIDKKLVSEIVDANKKVCNDYTSYVSMTNDGNTYVLKVNLSCSTNENEEVFYYNLDNYTCLNCNGTTNIKVDKSKDNEANNNENKNDNTGYRCDAWSEWTSVRVLDTSLIEKERTLYLGVKKEVKEEIVYTEWSDYTQTPIVPSDGVEVEIKKVTEKVWSDVKSASSFTPSDTVKLISVSQTGGGSYTYCPSGYNKDASSGKCVSTKSETGDLTYMEYTSGKYLIENKPCDSLVTVIGTGLVHKNCRYRRIVDMKKSYTSSSTTYNYQELEDKEVVYYRSRLKKIDVKVDNVYTTDYYEDNHFPNGYEKSEDHKKVEYAYKLKTCVK